MWQHVTSCGNVWQRVTTCDNVWQRVATCDNVWERVTTCDNMTKYDKIWHTTVCDCLASRVCRVKFIRMLAENLLQFFLPRSSYFICLHDSAENFNKRESSSSQVNLTFALSRERLRVHKIYKFCKKNPNQKVNVEVIWYFLRHFCLLESYLPKSNLKLSNKIMRNI